ncbi:ATP-binding cassette sub-family F member 2-like [Tubulanus polymorphus]|uniref:ATP-binding cassette sub-family F member 2-like n=1 Tax=Tubulanus polymorphus TaxID=672921 RepID=UPI003DA4EB54
MPSDAKKKRAAAKKDASKKKTDGSRRGSAASVSSTANGTANGSGSSTPVKKNGTLNGLDEVAAKLEGIDLGAAERSCTGVLASYKDSRDLRIEKLTMRFHGVELLTETTLTLNCGRRYGLIGFNGCGKSSLLAALGNNEIPIPDHVDVFHLKREMPPSDKTALETVMEVDKERIILEKEMEELIIRGDDDAHERIQDVTERLEEMDADKAEYKAGMILHGLGFTPEMQRKAVKDFSGGWRMRIALARALFIRPTMLLLDEPTNHLDLDACVWLESELKEYKRILVIVSHSQDFLNGVCTNIIHMHQTKLKFYTGNYDQYVQTRSEIEENQMKSYKRQQSEIAHMKDYIARFGHGSAKLARQAQSKEKTLRKMVEGGLTQKVTTDRTLTFYFPECGKLPPPVIQVQNVCFRYSDDKPYIYRDLDFGMDLDTRVALVGPNGAGKSTLLKLIAGQLHPTDGLIRRHSHIKIGRYHQHLQELLDLEQTALDWMMKQFPDIKEREEMRKIIGRFGLTGQQQICPMQNLSDGQRCRVIFAWLAWQSPHLLLLDEPTNHLDIETIDSLAEALNDFDGGMVLVSHDFRLIAQVAEEIWICDKQKVTKWEGSIFSYKQKLVKRCNKVSQQEMLKLNGNSK